MMASPDVATKQAILLTGPTGSGKTALAIAVAKQLPVTIISVDSAQIYRDMNLGTAKPDAATLAHTPHRLINIRAPNESYNVGDFCHDAHVELTRSWRQGRLPLLVGGTMMYFDALLNGLANLPKRNTALRAELDAKAAEIGWPAMHHWLGQLDPPTAEYIKAHDRQRIQRALEVTLDSDKPFSAWRRQAVKPVLAPAQIAGFYNLTYAPSATTRAALHQRFAKMVDQGLEQETRELCRKYALDRDCQAMRIIGYRHVWQMWRQQLALDQLKQLGGHATAQYAKRQRTWLRNRFKHAQHLAAEQFDQACSTLLKHAERACALCAQEQ